MRFPSPHCHRAPSFALAALFLAVLATPSGAQDAYGMTEERAVRWNGTIMDKLPGSYRVKQGNGIFFSFSTFTGGISGGGLTIFIGTGSKIRFYDRWVDHQVVGADRWALRADGRVHKNGKKVKELFGVFGSQDWVAFDVANGHHHAVRRDGVQTTDLDLSLTGTVQLEEGDSFFMDIKGLGDTAVALRADGALFLRQQPDAPVLWFHGGPGKYGHLDGETLDTIWHRLAVQPDTGRVFALRRDGVVMAGFPTLPAPPPVVIENLPGNGATTGTVTMFKLTYPGLGDWVELEFTDSGRWRALRGDGTVWGDDDNGTADQLIKYKGASSFKTIFTHLATFGERMQAIRRDGAVFRDGLQSALVKMKGDGYIRTAITDVDPDIETIKNALPVTSRYKLTLLEGQAAEVPVLSTDTDLPTSQIGVEVIGDLPGGITWDPESRSFAVDGTLPVGSVKIQVRVDDFVAKARTERALTIKVTEIDTDPDRNKKPSVGKVTKTQPLVDEELVVPLIPYDPDGDAVTITPRLDKGVFALPLSDASYDDTTREFRWTPVLLHIGKNTAEFDVSDGTTTRKFVLKLNVLAPFVSD